MRHIITANYIFRQYCSFCWDVDIYKLFTCRCLVVSLSFLAGRQDMCPCSLSLFLTVLVETLTFVGQWLRRVLDVAYLCWRASRTNGFAPSPWMWPVLHITGVFSVSSQYTIHRSLWHLHCLGNMRYCSPRCFHPNDLPSLADGTFSHDEFNWPVTKSWLLGWPKLCWFQLYCSTTISLIFARHVTRYIHIILTIFQEATQCLTLWKISLKMFCKNFFPGVYIFILDLTSGFKRFGKESRKAARKSFKCWGLVRLILKTWQYPWFRAERSLSKSWIINYSFTVCKQSQLRPLHTNTHRENEIMSKSKKGKYKNELWTATETRNSISFKDKLSSRSFTSRGSDNWKLHSQLIEVFLDIYAEYNSAC